ncbi:hypothetical protein OE88DRAFT_1805505 [Heliocybe sulcata]|uniref:Uncharacterized protein n=1 Tax=Heliocybe sulcata TaxID=5364 RepID=A0A5C3NE08_9AGAM|nr:hypothetical protein OE88DRAFT_1805505 [Heliocybe sulcata]
MLSSKILYLFLSAVSVVMAIPARDEPYRRDLIDTDAASPYRRNPSEKPADPYRRDLVDPEGGAPYGRDLAPERGRRSVRSILA